MDLSQLYQIKSATNFAYFEKYTAVLLTLGEEMLKTVDDHYLHLITVWDRNRKILYKECLQEEPLCWGFCGSKLLYMTEKNQAKIIDFDQKNDSQEYEPIVINLPTDFELLLEFTEFSSKRLIGLVDGKNLVIV